MAYQWCHGPNCHTNHTQDRIRGVKGNKVLRTRKITTTRWNENNVWSVFCSQGCYTDFFYRYWQQVIAIAPRTEPLETPIEVKQVKREGYQYRYGDNGQYERVPHTYISKEIVDRTNEN
jgi:hypothetical protein